MMKLRTIALISSALTATLFLAGCSTGASTDGANSGATSAPSAEESAAFNVADQMFASMMIPHHEQAVEMADLVLDKADIDDRVVNLAQDIKAAQDPEIVVMEGWLTSWGIDYDSSEVSGMESMGDGMMSGTDMDQLQQADGSEASRLFLEQMIEHHEGAIVMAQADEIATMRAILETL